MNLFPVPPPQPPVAPEEVAPKYRYWRTRQLYSTFLGYAVYYFVRKNLSCAMPLMEKDLGIGKAQLGGFLTAHGVIYGLSKFLNGMVADRSNARTFMAFGLFCSALVNLAFGFSSGALALGIFWMLNGWFQGIGFPPCARILSHWFAPQERGVKWGIWNTSHQVGGAVILWLGGWLGQHYGWRAVFYVPALFSIVISLFLLERLRDTPKSMGLPDVEVFVNGQTPPSDDEPAPTAQDDDFAKRLRKRVFGNPFVWAICFGNFFVYVVRYVFFDWWPTFLTQERHFELSQATQLTSYFELAGLVGSLLAGFLSDRWLHGKRNPVCLFYLLGTLGVILFYRQMPVLGYWQEAAAVAAVGFFIYGPQFLVGVMVTDIAGKEAAASAIGLTGFFGYLSGVLSGYGLGKMVDLYGWGVSFQLTIGCTICALVCFAVCGRKT